MRHDIVTLDLCLRPYLQSISLYDLLYSRQAATEPFLINIHLSESYVSKLYRFPLYAEMRGRCPRASCAGGI